MIAIKKLLSIMVALIALLAFSQGIVASEGINIVINNNVVLLSEDEQKPFILEGRTYVPLRVISENLGAAVEWDGVNQQILIRTTLMSMKYPPTLLKI